MSQTKSHFIRSIRAGATTALLAVVIGVLSGGTAFALAAPGAPHAEAADIEPVALVDRLAAVPDFVAPTPTPTAAPEPTPEPPGESSIRAAVTSVDTSNTQATVQPRVTAPVPTTIYDRSAIIEAIYAVWPAHLAPTAVVIAECESSMNPAAVNPSSGAAGLFQALGHGPVPADPYSQSVQALAIYNEQGSWRPWTASIHCWG